MAKLEVQELGNNIKQIKIVGRLDIQGTGEIETPFTAHTASKKAKVVVDLSELDFIASIGIRLLVTTAKAQTNRGGKLVLLFPKPLVEEAIVTSGIDLLIPIYHDFACASEDLTAGVIE